MFGGDKDFFSTMKSSVLIVAPLLIIIFPIALIDNLSGLRYATILSIVSILYIVFVIIIETPFYIKNLPTWSTDKINYINITPDQLLIAYSVIVLSYVGHSTILTILSELQQPEDKRLGKVNSLQIAKV